MSEDDDQITFIKNPYFKKCARCGCDFFALKNEFTCDPCEDELNRELEEYDENE
jgi:hypothetical protein